ncbi:MAG: phosphopantetheine-binding protein, partial [Opitutaceae bacterium]
MKRCSASTYEAACQFRKTGNTEHLSAIVLGIIERYVEPDLRTKLKDPDDDLRLIEDLGIDSLTMMEIVILVEDVLQMSINNEELRYLRTLGDVKQFIECKVRGLPLPKPTKFLPIEQIVSIMPIQPPFLFLNEASVGSQGASAKYRISGQEFFLQGHFKDNPVMPASIMLESLGQLALLFLL